MKEDGTTQTVNVLVAQVFSLLSGEWMNVLAQMPKPSPGWTLENSADITPPISASNLGPINVLNLCVDLIVANPTQKRNPWLRGAVALVGNVAPWEQKSMNASRAFGGSWAVSSNKHHNFREREARTLPSGLHSAVYFSDDWQTSRVRIQLSKNFSHSDVTEIDAYLQCQSSADRRIAIVVSLVVANCIQSSEPSQNEVQAISKTLIETDEWGRLIFQKSNP